MDLYQAALAYTARYATSKENLRRVLWRKLRRQGRRTGEQEPEAAVAEAEIASVIKRLEGIGAVDDRSYGETLVRTLKARGTSARAARAKLAAKGVPPTIAEDLLCSPAPETEERAAAARYAERRRLGPYRKGGLSPEQRSKDLAAMCRAGFSFGVALEIIGGATDPE